MKDGVLPERPEWAWEVGVPWGLKRPSAGATPGSEQPLVSIQSKGWTDGEQPCPEGIGDAGRWEADY